MQKKLIALAVAGLVSAPVMAQSNVQVYGIADLGINYFGSSDTNARTMYEVGQGNAAASRLGFRGTEDLGNGLAAFFNFEYGVDADAGGNFTGRQTFAGLRGNFGQISLGRQFNPARNLVAGLDPFGTSGVGNLTSLYNTQVRYDNSVIYVTPNFSGLTVSVAYTTNAGGQDVVTFSGDPDTNNSGFSVTPVYRNGPITLGASYERLSADQALGGANVDNDTTRWSLAGGYDFGAVNLTGGYGRVEWDRNGPGVGDDEQRQWFLGATMPVSEAGKLLASYTNIKYEEPGESSARASRWAVGYSHALSKRTNVYATYAHLNTNSTAEGQVGLRGGNALNDDGAFTRGVNVGVRHNF